MTVITLIGNRGCGKSTVGKILAKEINFKFIDLDEYMMNYLKDDGGIMGFTKKRGLYYYNLWGKNSKEDPWVKGWHDYAIKLKAFILEELSGYLEKGDFVLDCGGGTTYSGLFKENDDIAKYLKSISTFVLIESHSNIDKAINQCFIREKERRESTRRDEREYVMKDFDDDELYKKVKDDYLLRIFAFRKQADLIIYNTGTANNTSNEIIFCLKKKKVLK